MLKFENVIRASVLAFVGTVIAPAWPAAAQLLAPDDAVRLAEKAETKDDHLKLADHYDAEAARYQTAAEHHDALAKTYKRPNLPPRFRTRNRNMANHCSTLARYLRDAAKASESLARAHRAIAADLDK